MKTSIEFQGVHSKFVSLLDELRFLDSLTCDIEKIPHLVAVLSLKTFPKIVSPLLGDSKFRSVYGGEGFIPVNLPLIIFYICLGRILC